MATGDLSDADVFGGATAPKSMSAAAPADPAPIEVDIDRAVTDSNGRPLRSGSGLAPPQAAPSAAPSTDLTDADVFGPDAHAAPGGSVAQPHGDDLLGFETGLKRPLDNAASWVEGGLEHLGIPVVEAEHAIGAKSAGEVKADDENYLKLQAAQGKTPGIAGNLVGSAIGTTPALMLPGGVLVQGAATGALGSNHDDLQGVAKDAAGGGIAGKLGSMVMGALSRIAAPAISPYVQTLLDAGVKLTPGQILGGAAHRIEDSLTSTPVLGDAIRDAQVRGLQSLNAAAIGRSLDPIGVKLPANARSGRAAVDFAHQALSNAYDEVTSKLSHLQADQQFTNGVANVVKGAQGDLTADTRAQLADIVGNRVLSRFSPGGTLDGASFKDVDGQLGMLIRKFGASTDANQQHIGSALEAVQDELRAAAQRGNPGLAPKLDAINSGWANLVKIEKAAGGVGAKGGVFTGPQLQAAVRATDGSVRKSAFARGNAPMQDLSDAASKVLPSSVPDSGTALRYLISELPILLGVGSESHVLPLGGAGAAMVGGGLIGSAYTKTGGAVVQKLLTARPPGAQYVSSLLAHAKTPIGHLGASVAPLLQYAGQSSTPPAAQ